MPWSIDHSTSKQRRQIPRWGPCVRKRKIRRIYSRATFPAPCQWPHAKDSKPLSKWFSQHVLQPPPTPRPHRCRVKHRMATLYAAFVVCSEIYHELSKAPTDRLARSHSQLARPIRTRPSWRRQPEAEPLMRWCVDVSNPWYIKRGSQGLETPFFLFSRGGNVSATREQKYGPWIKGLMSKSRYFWDWETRAICVMLFENNLTQHLFIQTYPHQTRARVSKYIPGHPYSYHDKI